MRGQVHTGFSLWPGRRITPADAGTSHERLPIHRHHQDHPRGCGDKYLLSDEVVKVEGSPPRMRGQGYRESLPVIKKRITPADAGTSPPIPFAPGVF